MRGAFFVSSMLLLTSVAGRSEAQLTPLDAREFQVNTYTTELQGAASVARGAGGGFVVVWTSEGSPGSDTSGYSIQAQRFDASGRQLGAQFQVNTYTTGHQFAGTVASDVAGNFVVVWASEGSFGSDSDRTSVQARRFRADGTPLDSAELQVNTYTTGYQERPGLAADSEGDFVVVWSGGSFLAYDVYARRYRADGVPRDPVELQVNSYTTGDQRTGGVAARPNGDFVVVWTSYGSFGSDDSEESVQARRFAADGAPLDATELQVNVFTPGPQHLPAVAVAPGGEFVVTWDSDYGPEPDPFLSVQARRFGPDGTPLDPSELQVNEYTPNGQFLSSVAVNAEGDFTVVWTSLGSFGNDQDGFSTQARRFRSDGSAVDAEESQVNAYTTFDQFGPEIAAGPDGDFVVAWWSFGSFENDPDWSIQARRFGRPAIAVTSASGGSGGPGCTLRDAIAAANASQAVGECPAGNEGAVIELPAGSSIALTEADNGANGLPAIERPVTILGRGARIERDPGLACPAGPEFRVFEVADGGVLTLEDVSVSNGCLPSSAGAGVYSSGGTVVLRRASIEGNETGSDGGGVALVGGNLLAFDSTVRGNLAAAEGGGISLAGDPGWVLLDRATLSENVAASGGGLAVTGTASALIRNATFSGNVAALGGGGFALASGSASATLDFSTVTENEAPSGAGALLGAGALSLHGSLVGENVGGADCAAGGGSVSASGGNLDTDGSCAALAGGGVATVASLGLGPLVDNGGWVRTHLPLAGSPALDAAPACAFRSGASLSSDARGYPRPTDDDSDGEAECELGAVERGVVFVDGFESSGISRWSYGVP